MAIVVETLVRRASKDDADRLDDSVNAAIGEMGGPPAGLMVHLTRPEGDGFLLSEVWRTEADMRSFYEDVILPKLADAGLEPLEPVISPVWVLADPSRWQAGERASKPYGLANAPSLTVGFRPVAGLPCARPCTAPTPPERRAPPEAIPANQISARRQFRTRS